MQKRLLALFLLAPLWLSAFPLEFYDGEVTGSLDNTVTFGVGLRTAKRDLSNVGVSNGGSYLTLNEDDGNLNYDQWDLYTAAIKTNHELELNYKNWSFFSRLIAFYDFDVMHGSTQRTPLSHTAKDRIGWDVELQDIYVNWVGNLRDKPLSLRVGNQVLSWGESTFIQNSLNSINPVDVARLRTAGAQLRDALLPVPMIRADLTLSDSLSIGGFWQVVFKEVILDPKGTYFSTNDFVSPGGNFAMLSTAGLGDDVGLTVPFSSVSRGEDKEGKPLQNFGLSLTYFAEDLNYTEFGFYFAWMASRLPLISVFKGAPNLALGAAAYIPSSYYFVEYPNDIKMLGASFNTMLETWALQGEVSLRFDQPIQIDDAQLLAAALVAPGTDIPGTVVDGLPEGFSKGYRRKTVSQIQMTATNALGPTWKADDFIIVAEAGGTYIHGMESRSVIHYEAPGTAMVKGYGRPIGAGYRLLLRAVFNNAIGAATLTPSLAWSHDLVGTIPAPITTFVQGRMQTTLKLDWRYLDWSGNVAWTSYFGGVVHNLLRDRDFLTFSVSYAF